MLQLSLSYHLGEKCSYNEVRRDKYRRCRFVSGYERKKNRHEEDEKAGHGKNIKNVCLIESENFIFIEILPSSYYYVG